MKSNIVTINSITVKDNAGNERKYNNNPVSCSYNSGGRNNSGSFSCPTGNPESQCTLNGIN